MTPPQFAPSTIPVQAPAKPRSSALLGAAEFARVLERERCLADRGTRCFSVLGVQAARGGDAASRRALELLAQRATRRLRSTDLVGRISSSRLELLLSDTEPAGARVVALWMQLAAESLGLELEQTILVYPSVAEARPEPVAAASAACAPHWPTDDLWPRFVVRTPAWKRALDIVLSATALLALLPLFALIALAIRLDSKGPVIFRQQRAGRGGRPFAFLKFRSMSAGAEAQLAGLAARNEQEGPVFKMHDDPRVTRVGRPLRRWSLDELPQLWNVLVGDISLVGPRSPTMDEVAKYERWQRRRLAVTGGITCTWQVSGRSEIPFRDWMRLDLRYVAARGLWSDLRLLALTLPAVIGGRGAH